MQKLLAAVITGAVLALSAAELSAADKVSGTWSWTQQRRGGQGGQDNATPAPARKTTLKLKADGEKLTGTLSAPAGGRGGQGGGGAAAQPRETEISDGKVKGDEISFSVKREFNGNAFVTKYTGKVEGDKITGKIEMPGRDGGDPRSIDWNATREAAEKAPEKK
jgi:hypothetical protein